MNQYRFDAFISYSHTDCGKISEQIQKGIENIGKPWFKLNRQLNVFRDETNLTASPELWSNIEQALSNSKYFILLASPLASKSVWIGKEVTWWITNRDVKSLFIVHVSGNIKWSADDNDFDWEVTNSLPSILRGHFAQEPFWGDYTFFNEEPNSEKQSKEVFKKNIIKIIAGITGKDIRAIDSDEKRKLNVVRQLMVVIGLVLLFLVGLAAMLFLNFRKEHQLALEKGELAKTQQNLASLQQRVAKSNFLISQANTLVSTNFNKALVLYANAYYLNPDTLNFRILDSFYEKCTQCYENRELQFREYYGIFNTFNKTLRPNFIYPLDTVIYDGKIHYDQNDKIDTFRNKSKHKLIDFSLVNGLVIKRMNDKIYKFDLNNVKLDSISCPDLELSECHYFEAHNKMIIISKKTQNTIKKSGLFVLDVGTMKLSQISSTDWAKDSMFDKYINENDQQRTFQLFFPEDRDFFVAYFRGQGFQISDGNQDNDDLMTFNYIYPFDTKASKTVNISSKLIETQDFINIESVSPDNNQIILESTNMGNNGMVDQVCIDINENKSRVLYSDLRDGNSGSDANSGSKGCPIVFHWMKRWLKMDSFNGDAGKKLDTMILMLGYLNGHIGVQQDSHEIDYQVNATFEGLSSLSYNEDYIIGGTEDGHLIVWRNDVKNSYSHAESGGFTFIRTIPLSSSPIVAIKTHLNYMACADEAGAVYIFNIADHKNLSSDTAILKKQIASMEIDKFPDEIN